MKEKTGKKVLVGKGLLGAVIAVVVCGGVYAGLTAYVRNNEEAKVTTGWKKEEDTKQEADRDPIASVVTDSEEVTYDRFEIAKDGTSITIGKAGNETIAGVTNPNSTSAKKLTLMTKGVGFAQIVYPAGNDDAKVAAQNLNIALAKKTGYQLKLVADTEKETAYEILVGVTNRSSGQIQNGAYSVQTTNDKVELLGTTATSLDKAVTYFVGQVTAKSGELTVAKNISYVWNSSNSYHQTILSANANSVKTEKKYSTIQTNAELGMDVLGIPQGGCSDGRYFYQMLITKQVSSDENKNECKIVKIDMNTWKAVKVSDVLALNHANDVTYNSKLNCLVVCHNAPNRDTLSYVDINTLTITKTFQIDYEIYCIDYNASKDQYVVGLSGGQSFRMLDSDFKAVGKVHMPTDETKDRVTQGVGSDDEFIYFALYKSGGKCVIAVYDWAGNEVSILHLDDVTDKNGVQGREIETVSVVKGEIYLSAAATTWKSSEIYKVTGLTAK